MKVFTQGQNDTDFKYDFNYGDECDQFSVSKNKYAHMQRLKIFFKQGVCFLCPNILRHLRHTFWVRHLRYKKMPNFIDRGGKMTGD